MAGVSGGCRRLASPGAYTLRWRAACRCGCGTRWQCVWLQPRRRRVLYSNGTASGTGSRRLLRRAVAAARSELGAARGCQIGTLRPGRATSGLGLEEGSRSGVLPGRLAAAPRASMGWERRAARRVREWWLAERPRSQSGGWTCALVGDRPAPSHRGPLSALRLGGAPHADVLLVAVGALVRAPKAEAGSADLQHQHLDDQLRRVEVAFYLLGGPTLR